MRFRALSLSFSSISRMESKGSLNLEGAFKRTELVFIIFIALSKDEYL